MFCKHCGERMNDTDVFCTKCGKPLASAQPSAETPVYQPYQTPQNTQSSYYAPSYEAPRAYPSNGEQPVDEERSALASEILRYGIMSLAFSCTIFLALVGIIFSIVTKNKVATYTELYGPVSWKSKVGKSLGKAGLFAGIGGLAYFVFYILYFFLLLSLM